MSGAPENPSEFERSERFWGGFGRAGAGRGGPRRGSDNGSADPSDPQGPPPLSGSQDHECLDWCPICRTAELLRGTTPDEVREQFTQVQHDALVALRAVLNAYIERLKRAERPSAARPVEDIPID
jgi:hypothetical protein